MSVGGELYGDHAARLFYGANARHVSAWMYIQDQGPGVVSLVGASRVTQPIHPLRYGGAWTHGFMVGELIVRPHLLVGTNALRGYGLAALATSDHDLDEMLADGELIIGTQALLNQLRGMLWPATVKAWRPTRSRTRGRMSPHRARMRCWMRWSAD